MIRAFFTDGVIEGAKNPENERDELAPECVWKVLIPSFTRSDGLEMAPENDLRHPYENHRQFLGLSKHTPARVKIICEMLDRFMENNPLEFKMRI